MAPHANTPSTGGFPNEPRTPVKQEDLLPQAPNNTTTWDFTPFLSTPAVVAKAAEGGINQTVNLLSIPRSKLPSPLIDKLSPRQIMDVRDCLVGSNGQTGCRGNGKEIWLSWKRAWDVWNNHYIEGRINPVWVRSEWEEREARTKEWDRGRDDRRRARERRSAAAAGAHKQWDPNHNPLTPENQYPNSMPFHTRGSSTSKGSKGTSACPEQTRDPVIAKALVDSKTPDLPPYAAKSDQWWEKVGSKSPKGKKREDVWFLHDKNAFDYGSDNPEFASASSKNPRRATDESMDGSGEERDAERQQSRSGSRDNDAQEADFNDKHDYDNQSEASDSEPPPRRPNADGSSGGYKPLKMLEEYYEPGDEEFDGKVWIDAVANTVWAPRRVREKKLSIELDDDIEDFCKKTDLKVNGGLDCSRSPVPLLRPLTGYIHTKEGAFQKKKAWDGVNRTVFNIPTQPLVPCTEIADERKQRIKDMYWDPIHDDQRGKDNKIFPLNIRRVLKVRPDLDIPKDICDEGETRVRDPPLYPEDTYRCIKPEDPWYVTEDQKRARDAPPRRHPPKQLEFSGRYLPLDDELWKEERLRDLNQDAGYFITNLHGGTLIINGMEIKKGDVGGPLPEFAVIECPGGQVAFWWGDSGRPYGEKRLDIDHSRKWEILRRIDDSWINVAKPAGEVWDAIMTDRKEREKTGEPQDDDDQWALWKKARKAKPKNIGQTEEPRQLGRYGLIPLFSKDDETEELKWLIVQQEEKAATLKLSQQVYGLIVPDERSL